MNREGLLPNVDATTSESVSPSTSDKSQKRQSATFLIGSLTPRTGGDVYECRIRTYLQSQGWDIDARPLDEFRERTRGHLAYHYGWLLPNPALALWTAMRTVRHVGSVRGLIIADNDFSRVLLTWNLLTVLLRRGTILFVVHHFEDYESIAKPSLRKSLQIWKYKIGLWPASQIVTVSQYSKREIVSLGIDPKRITIIQPGVDYDRIDRPPKSPSDEVHIITLGNIAPRKGTLHLVEAFIKIARPNAHLHIVGGFAWKGDPYNETLKQLAANSGMADRIHFHGRLPQEEVHRLLCQADIFAMPSLQEGFGMALLEAMHYGLPVITTNISALPELVEDGVNGLLVPPADSAALAKALERLVDSAALRQSLGNEARQRVEGRYAWKSRGQKFEQLMETMLPKQA
jgi:glycosyltransferase involved in cell wall biosynthesis